MATEALPGRTSLRRCLRDVSGEVDIDGLIDCSELVGTGKDAFVECATGSTQPDSGSESGTWSPPARRWPSFEIALRSGGYRYSCEPDLCVGRDDQRRPFPTVVAQVAETSADLSPLHEVQDVANGRIGYISQLELDSATVETRALGVVGWLQPTSREAVPLVRLRRDVDPPEGDFGHRLANPRGGAWPADGYTPEGVVGFAWRPDPTRAPLYRWRDTARGTFFSLGSDASLERSDLAFEGTLGSAWVPTVSGEGYVDLWEMERGGGFLVRQRPVTP